MAEVPTYTLDEELAQRGELPGGRISFARGFGWYKYGRLRLESWPSDHRSLLICDVLAEDSDFLSDPFTQELYASRLTRLRQRDPFRPDVHLGFYVEGYCQTKQYPPFIIGGGFDGLRRHKNPQLIIRTITDVRLRLGGIHPRPPFDR